MLVYIGRNWHNRAPASGEYTITPEDGHVRPKHGRRLIEYKKWMCYIDGQKNKYSVFTLIRLPPKSREYSYTFFLSACPTNKVTKIVNGIMTDAKIIAFWPLRQKSSFHTGNNFSQYALLKYFAENPSTIFPRQSVKRRRVRESHETFGIRCFLNINININRTLYIE
jgi:hypothetical protein